jgi:hypothetical protein
MIQDIRDMLQGTRYEIHTIRYMIQDERYKI